MSRPRIGVKQLRDIHKRLREIKRVSTMETADFDGISTKGVYIQTGKKTKFIKEQTELWRESWITSPLHWIIRELEPFIED